MGKYKSPKMTKGEYIRFKADQIEALITINGTDFNFNILTLPVSEQDKVFHKHYSEILIIMKDRGYKVWGTGDEGNGICKWHITL
jgi:hypothetical protein